MAEPVEYVGDDAGPVALAALGRGDALQIVAERA